MEKKEVSIKTLNQVLSPFPVIPNFFFFFFFFANVDEDFGLAEKCLNFLFLLSFFYQFILTVLEHQFSVTIWDAAVFLIYNLTGELFCLVTFTETIFLLSIFYQRTSFFVVLTLLAHEFFCCITFASALGGWF